MLKLGVVALTAVSLAAVVGTAPASAETDLGAFTLYAAVVAQDTQANLADTAGAAGDNITCDPAAVVDGHMINPRAGVVVGEVYGQDEVVAAFKCVSLDTGASYTLTGTISDMYYSAGAYSTGATGWDSMHSVAGAAVVHPFAIGSYPGGSRALNTWHYAHFVGTTTTGRRIAGNSPLFYVAGV